MKKYAILISYVGTRYCGWQKQKGSAAEKAPSIQETIESGLRKITLEDVHIVGSGRTDSGVHALGQIAHFVLKKKNWNPENLKRGLNSLLPSDIRVIASSEVDDSFHSQKSAIQKQYSYYFQQGPCALPHLEPYSWWIKKKLDLKLLNQALGHLLGEHDFKPFRASGAKPGPSVRKILEAEAVYEPLSFPSAVAGMTDEFGLVRIRLIGTGFLKQMVRGIAGTLLQIGEKRRDSECIREILEKADRSLVGPTAPARALWLERVWYPNQLTFPSVID